MRTPRLSHLLVAAAPAALALFGACRPSLPDTPPSTFVIAEFDPTTSTIPLPNDLVFLQDPNTLCPGNTLPAGSPPACAQAELIASFNEAYPSDQEVAITIDFAEIAFDANGSAVQTAPDLDLTSFTPSTYFVEGTVAGAGTGEIAMEPIQASDYVKSADHGELTLHHQGHLPWSTGNYAVLIRGGDEGVKTTDGLPVNASQIFSLLEQNVNLADPKNNGLLKAQLGSQQAANLQGLQLDAVETLYKQLAFPAAAARFPYQDLAITTTFTVGPVVTNVTIDPARSIVPLPIDLLRDPTTGKLSALAACTLAGSSLGSDGTCPSASAAGFEALDGFSTTGAILAQTSELIDGTTVNADDLQLWDLSDKTNPVQVPATSLILEPCEFTSGCNQPTELSPVIAIQPAGATAGDPTSVFRTQPLKDATDYAVVITTGVKDKAGNPIGPGTVAKIVHFTNPISISGVSQLQGIDNTTALSLENMRLELQPLFNTLATAGTDFSKIGIAYTFHTQTVLAQATELAELPYALGSATSIPIAASLDVETGSAAYVKYGVDSTRVSTADIGEILEVDMHTMNGLDPLTGAFLANPEMGSDEIIHVLIATPTAANANLQTCSGATAALAPLKCAPMMIFRHGLGGGRADMLTVANEYAKAGLVTVAIDAAKHGDRAYCTPGTQVCRDGSTCQMVLPAGAQGDTLPPGTCGSAGYYTAPVSPTCTGACATDATDGIPVVSGNYLISTNFFRTRDTLRQDIIDQSELVRVMAYIPTTGLPTGHAVFDQMASTLGMVIDPTRVYYSGQSLGAIQGAADVATDPRISKAGFNVGGGTVVDIFTNSPAFVSTVDQLLASIGIEPGTSAYLQFLVVAKTVLDPADPANFVGHLTANTLPDWTSSANPLPAQAPKAVISQMAFCDQTVPNPFNLIYASNLGASPLPTGAAFFTPGATGSLELFVGTGFSPAQFDTCSPLPASAVEHAFITDWLTPAITKQAQDDIASFVTAGTLPPTVQE